MARRSVVQAQQQPQAQVQQRAIQPQQAQPPQQRPSAVMQQNIGGFMNQGGTPAIGTMQAPPGPANGGMQPTTRPIVQQPEPRTPAQPGMTVPDYNDRGRGDYQGAGGGMGLSSQELQQQYQVAMAQGDGAVQKFMAQHPRFQDKTGFGNTVGQPSVAPGYAQPPPVRGDNGAFGIQPGAVPPGYGPSGPRQVQPDRAYPIPDSRQPEPAAPPQGRPPVTLAPPFGGVSNGPRVSGLDNFGQPSNGPRVSGLDNFGQPSGGGGGPNPSQAPVPQETGSGPSNQAPGQTQVPPDYLDPWVGQEEWEAQQGIPPAQGQQAGGQTQGQAGSPMTSLPNSPQGSPTSSPQDSWNAYWENFFGAKGSGAGSQGAAQAPSMTSPVSGPSSSATGGQVPGAGSQPQVAGASVPQPAQAVAGPAANPAGVAPSGTSLSAQTQEALSSAGITPAGQPNRFDPTILGLPNSPEFMRAEMTLMDELSRTLMDLGIARDQIPAEIAQFKARFETDTGLRQRQTSQAMADRGIMGSSVASRAEWEAQIPEARHWRDYLMGQQGRYNELAQGELGAKLGYKRSMEELLYDYAQGLHEAPPSSVYSGNRDYYEQGGGNQPYYNASAPGGYLEQYDWYNQPTRPEWYDPRDWMDPAYWGTVSPSGPGR